MSDVLRQMDLSLSSYSLAPCWSDEMPYYGLFIERADVSDPALGRKLAAAVDRRLGEVNEEYAAKRQSRRLGPIRLQVLKAGSWDEWDRNRLARTGGTMEQYKRPALVSDPKLRESLSVEEEWTGG
jgi:hypothetical protein